MVRSSYISCKALLICPSCSYVEAFVIRDGSFDLSARLLHFLISYLFTTFAIICCCALSYSPRRGMMRVKVHLIVSIQDEIVKKNRVKGIRMRAL